MNIQTPFAPDKNANRLRSDLWLMPIGGCCSACKCMRAFGFCSMWHTKEEKTPSQNQPACQICLPLFPHLRLCLAECILAASAFLQRALQGWGGAAGALMQTHFLANGNKVLRRAQPSPCAQTLDTFVNDTAYLCCQPLERKMNKSIA